MDQNVLVVCFQNVHQILYHIPSHYIYTILCVVIVIVPYSSGEGGSYDATEERQKQIIRDRLRANAVCILCVCTYICMCVCIHCTYTESYRITMSKIVLLCNFNANMKLPLFIGTTTQLIVGLNLCIIDTVKEFICNNISYDLIRSFAFSQ